MTSFTEKNEKRETEAYCELELSDTEQWKESYNNGRRPRMLNDIAAWKSLLCTSPSVDGLRRVYLYNNAGLSECPSRLLRALWASRCTKYKHAFALFIPERIRLYGEISRCASPRWLSIIVITVEMLLMKSRILMLKPC